MAIRAIGWLLLSIASQRGVVLRSFAKKRG